MKKFATNTATKRYLSQFPNQKSRVLGKTGLHCSAFGFGSYRIDTHHPDHKLALLDALRSGINLIDTSSNYSDGDSERLIGEALNEAFQSGAITREELIIISKAGYIQGSNYQQCFESGQSKYPETAHFYEGFAHSIQPDFIKDQVEASLNRLGLDGLDCFLIHNPEYQLMWAINEDRQNPEEAKLNFMQQLMSTFDMLEQLVEDGLIKSYGISSNTFPSATTDPHHCSLLQCLEIARSIKEDHHFSVIQFPFNMLEVSAAVIGQDEKQTPLIYLAKEHELGTLINRPLNAVIDNQLFRLSESTLEQVDEEYPDLSLIESIEDELIKQVDGIFDAAQEVDAFTETCLQLSRLVNSAQQDSTFDNWKEWINVQLIPRTQIGFQVLSQKKSDSSDSFIETFSNYIRLIHTLCTGITHQLYADKQIQTQGLRAAINKQNIVPDTLPLSQAVLGSYLSLDISSVLVGMRHPVYVKDVTQAAKLDVNQKPDSSLWIDIHLQLEKENTFTQTQSH